MADPPDPKPSLPALFAVFLAIGMQSFGGGLSGWMRREIVQQRGWMEERQFLSGLALCQIAPGPNAVNLAVFIGTTLRGAAGAASALGGMLGVPVLLVLALGAAFAAVHDASRVEAAMAGVGAAAIGLNFATGIRLARRNVRRPAAIALAASAAVAVGLFDAPLPLVLLLLVPTSLAVAVRFR